MRMRREAAFVLLLTENILRRLLSCKLSSFCKCFLDTGETHSAYSKTERICDLYKAFLDLYVKP